MGELRFFNPYAEIRFTANRLPHWQQEGAVYFVTFRLADAVPHNLRTQWESERDAWLRVHSQPLSTNVEANIMNGSQAQSNVGLTLVMVPASCGAPIAQPTSRKRYAILMVNVLYRSLGW